MQMLTRLVFAAALMPALPALAGGDGPETRSVTVPQSVTSMSSTGGKPVPFDDLYFTRNIGDAAWSPDGKEIAFTTDLAGRSNIWKMRVEGSWPVQLVQSEERQFAAAWSPDGKWLVYQQDKGGDEMWDLYAVPSSGGAVINLTNTPDQREETPDWAPDGKSIAMLTKSRDGQAYDIAVLDWATRKTRSITHEKANYSWRGTLWSKDSKTIYANRIEIGGTDGDVYAIDVATGALRNLTKHDGTIRYLANSLSPDGRALLISSAAHNNAMNVALLDIAHQTIDWVTDTRWEALAGHFSPDGRQFSYQLNADGMTDTWLVDIQTRKQRRVSLPAGFNNLADAKNAFSPDGRRLLLTHESTLSPADFWVLNLHDNALHQLSHSSVATLSATPMPATQLVHYQSFDGKVISALMWVPFNLKRDGSNPALVLPHGGPTGQRMAWWDPDVAALVSRGYICIAPNVRGSTGYGMDFQTANIKDLGGGDLQDELYAARFLQQTGYVDAKKIGITGGSYGGFMTMMAIAKTPDVFAAAVEEFGIINWNSMLEHSDPMLNQYLVALLGDPVKDSAVYKASSPITYIHNVRVPLLILQGDNDPRVPKEEAMQVQTLLQQDGKTVDAHFYPEEGHGFSRRENQIDSIRRTVDWFDRYLKGVPAPDTK